jgi:hypothetical protein
MSVLVIQDRGSHIVLFPALKPTSSLSSVPHRHYSKPKNCRPAPKMSTRKSTASDLFPVSVSLPRAASELYGRHTNMVNNHEQIMSILEYHSDLLLNPDEVVEDSEPEGIEPSTY